MLAIKDLDISQVEIKDMWVPNFLGSFFYNGKKIADSHS